MLHEITINASRLEYFACDAAQILWLWASAQARSCCGASPELSVSEFICTMVWVVKCLIGELHLRQIVNHDLHVSDIRVVYSDRT